MLTHRKSDLSSVPVAIEFLLVAACSSCVPSFTCAPYTCSDVPSFTQWFHFESDCIGATGLCGFSEQSGSARLAGTIQPGEHGLLLVSGTTVRAALRASSAPRASESLRLIARCDDGASLVAGEELSIPEGTQQGTTEVPATTAWTVFDRTFRDLGAGTAAGTTVRPAALTLTVSGPVGSACVVDEVRFVASADRCSRDSGTGARHDARQDIRIDAPPDVRFDGGYEASDSRALLPPECTRDADCGTGGLCLTAFPGGFCTRHCAAGTSCWPGTVCDPVAAICVPACASGDDACVRHGGACTVPTTGQRVCLPACFVPGTPGTPSGYPMCVPGTACDVFRGSCVTSPSVGADNGAACTVDAECRGGYCEREQDPATHASAGWIGGYCFSLGRVPDRAEYVVGSPVPQSNCPPGSGIAPAHGELATSLTLCLKTCEAPSDCRPGYACDHRLSAMGGAPFFSNGVCVPVDCSIAGAMCPSGYACTTSDLDAASFTGVCTADPDAGVTDDAGTDAAGLD